MPVFGYLAKQTPALDLACERNPPPAVAITGPLLDTMLHQMAHANRRGRRAASSSIQMPLM